MGGSRGPHPPRTTAITTTAATSTSPTPMLRALQHSCAGSGTSFTTLIQTAVERKADLVPMQEPPVYRSSAQREYKFM